MRHGRRKERYKKNPVQRCLTNSCTEPTKEQYRHASSK
jgi:hypothetical protein